MKKVRFFPKTTVHWLRISKEEHESRQGLWMQMARDRQRFRRRIRSRAKLIEYCLNPVHGEKIRRVLFLQYCITNYE